MEILSASLHPFQGTLRQGGGRVGGEKNEEPTATASPREKPEKGLGAEQLSAREQGEVRKLQRRDREVRAHEQAHLAAGGSVVRGGASYQYARGPDGRLYAVGGEVAIDGSGVQGNPQATVLKAETIKRAALAPANPSSQDLQVAAAATLIAATARAEIRAEAREEQAEATEASSGDTAANNNLQQRLAESGALGEEEQGNTIDALI
ncbi:MAG: putative metalloprotease CJM1_0395 family protein [Sedimenticola sp.]